METPRGSRSRLYYNILPPLLFIVLIWAVKIVELSGFESFYEFGVYPRKVTGLIGIILSVFIHSDFNHLISNSISFFILAMGLIYFYRDLSYKVILFIWITSGILVWLGARPSYHIGASGLIYGIASFLFFSGIIRRDVRLMSVSMLVVFLYGGLIWGILPIFPRISWEFHFFGSCCGIVTAIAYRKQGPQKQLWSWDLEDDSDQEEKEKKNDTFNE